MHAGVEHVFVGIPMHPQVAQTNLLIPSAVQDLLETVSTALASAESGQEASQRLLSAAEQRAVTAAQVCAAFVWSMP